MTRAPTPKQMECLRQLRRGELADATSPTTAEVSRMAGRRADWSRPALAALEAAELVIQTMGRTWVLTTEGRALVTPDPANGQVEDGRRLPTQFRTRNEHAEA